MATKTAEAKKASAKKNGSAKSPAKHSTQHFRARLEKGDRALGWTIARVPFAPESLGKMVRLRVRGEIRSRAGNCAFRTSLFPDASRGGFYLLVNRAMQQGAGVHVGDEAEFALEADLEPREAELPDELAVLLDDEPGLRQWFDGLTEYMRREIGKWITAVKSDEARLHRAQQMAERLLATMEGERELPPILAAAFRERPKAGAGWQKMTPAQRRAGLMAIFYYQTPEARQKRVQKLCDDAEKRA